jgi:thiamine pyrophosphate-dependent acetolactate synthase large subunit-like protein
VEIVGDALVLVYGNGAVSEWHNLRPSPPSLKMQMGIGSPAGLGLALALPHRRAVVIDGDGSLLLNLGILATLGNFRPPNLTVFVMDNECYESIGGFPTATAGGVDLAAMAKGAGIKNASTTRTAEEFKKAAEQALTDNAFHFVVAKVAKGTKRMPSIYMDGIEEAYRFLRYIEESEGIHIISPALQPFPEELLR